MPGLSSRFHSVKSALGVSDFAVRGSKFFASGFQRMIVS
jgi:hypothetical protein